MSERPQETLKPYTKGEKLSARKLNRTVSAVNRLAGGLRPPRQTTSSPKNGTPGIGLAAKQFRVVSAHGDYLICNPQDGQSFTSDQVIVAKPYLLRRTEFEANGRNGITYEYTDDTQRTADDGDGTTETQHITPAYVEGDIIYAIRNFSGALMINDNSQEAAWVDINCDGRSWAAE